MVNISEKKATDVMNFLARRCGFKECAVANDFLCDDNSLMKILFKDDTKCIDHELLISKYGQLRRIGVWWHKSGVMRDVLKLIVENRKYVFVTCVDIRDCDPELVDSGIRPWVRVVKDNECLESLLLEADINNDYQ